MMRKQYGFNLIEVLIGLVIGMVGMLAVAQVLVTFSQQRNTAVQIMEAQGNGAMALYLLERDMGMAGFGLMDIKDCGTIQWYWNPTGCTSSCGLQSALSTKPVIITDGGLASDQIEVNYAQSASGAPGSGFLGQGAYASAYPVDSIAGFANGDMIVADIANSCTMGQITAINTAASTIEHSTDSPYNVSSRPGGATSGWDAPSASIKYNLVNLGSYVSKRYRVSVDSLAMAAFPQTGTFTNLVDGIVFMKAQYGLDTGSDNVVDTWANGTTAITTQKILALRIGIVARSPLFEKNAVDAPTLLTVLPDTGGDDAVTWTVPDTHYRYKSFYTIIPMRNVLWGS